MSSERIPGRVYNCTNYMMMVVPEWFGIDERNGSAVAVLGEDFDAITISSELAGVAEHGDYLRWWKSPTGLTGLLVKANGDQVHLRGHDEEPVHLYLA
jgi:hypothetical protein